MPSGIIVGDFLYIDGGNAIASTLRDMPEARIVANGRWRVAATPQTLWELAENHGVNLTPEDRAKAFDYEVQLHPEQWFERKQYNFGNTNPWKHQQSGADWLASRYAGMLAFGMGAGKSLTTIGAIAAWGVDRVVILCPSSVIGVWRREFEFHCGRPFAVLCVENGNSKTKADAISKFLSSLDDGTLGVVVVNYESAWREPIATVLNRQSWGAVVLDESHRIKSPSGKASKFAYKLGRRGEHRLCLTGTPMPHSPLDIYAQMRFLEPFVLGTSYTRFRARYALTDPMYPSRVLQYVNQEELSGLIDPWIYRVKTEDVVDLPGITHQRIGFDLGSKARKIYDSLEEEMIAWVNDCEIEVTNAMVKLLRLQQITSGYVSASSDAGEHTIGTEKLDAMADLISDIPKSEPVVVFCRFRHDLSVVEKLADKIGRKYGEISGRGRRDLTPHAKMKPGVELMAVQEQSGGVGIDLTDAHYAFWYSLSFSLGDFDQAVARQHRPGQKHHVHMYHMVANRTVDDLIYRALSKRRDVVEEVLNAMKEKVTV